MFLLTKIGTTESNIFFFSAFTPEQLVIAVQLATQFAIWVGFLSLLIELLGAIIRYKISPTQALGPRG